MASRYGHLEVVKVLVVNGAQIDIGDRDGATPLGLARWKQHTDIIAILENPAELEELKKLCEKNGITYADGSNWIDGCDDNTCTNGVISTVTAATCCSVDGEAYEDGQTWSEECKEYTCNAGVVSEPQML